MNGISAFLSEGKLNSLRDGTATELTSAIAEQYKQREKEIARKNEWKRTGTGAAFMNVMPAAAANPSQAGERLPIQGAAACAEGKVLYSLNFDYGGGLYIKDIANPEEPESPVIVRSKQYFCELDAADGRIVASMYETHLEKHLALLNIHNTDMQILTEGDCRDNNPTWSARDKNTVYYDSCGIAFDANGQFAGLGPRSVYRLNTVTGDLDEVLEGGDYDYLLPYESATGDLYYIRRPHKPSVVPGLTLGELANAPFKVLKALGGWLNFFTMRYSGESLKTSGRNPAQTMQKTQQQIFIEGNLIEAEKNLKQNEASGETNPGYAPHNWELMMRTSSGGAHVLKNGVISYSVYPDQTVCYSNGRYIIARDLNGGETVAAKAHMAVKII